jgi:heme/copper-type cytochrome/quinol oxidase subunit 2
MNTAVLVFAACAAACAIGHVAILRSVVRRGAALEDPGVPRPNFLVEVIWAVLPIVILAFVLTATWSKVRGARPQPPAPIMEVAR